VGQFLSKSIAGGLSAGVVLLWWPVLFERQDTVTSWLVRGMVWTVLLEVLVFALVPVERALWETGQGKRIRGRVGAAHTRLHSGSRRRKLGSLGALATVAVAVPVMLLAMGVQERTPTKAEAAPPRPIKVVRVTKVVKVKKVVQGAPVVRPEIVTTSAPSAAAPAAETDKRDTPAKSRVVVGRDAPAERGGAPRSDSVSGGGSVESCSGDACEGDTAPASSPSL
jgi:hypothetical protein